MGGGREHSVPDLGRRAAQLAAWAADLQARLAQRDRWPWAPPAPGGPLVDGGRAIAAVLQYGVELTGLGARGGPPAYAARLARALAAVSRALHEAVFTRIDARIFAAAAAEVQQLAREACELLAAHGLPWPAGGGAASRPGATPGSSEPTPSAEERAWELRRDTARLLVQTAARTARCQDLRLRARGRVAHARLLLHHSEARVGRRPTA